MAKDLNMQFSGRIGPLVGCLRYGKYYYRSRPGKMQQSPASKISSRNFGLASKAGKIMRQHLAQSIPNARDLQMQQKLAGRIHSWLQLTRELPSQPTTDIPFVNHFNFNPAAPLQEALRIQIDYRQTGPGMTQLQVPEFVPAQVIKAPATSTHVELCISAVALGLGSDTGFGNSSLIITIPYNDTQQPAQQIMLPLPTGPGNILIAALQLRYAVETNGQLIYLTAAKMPAAIVGAIYV